MSNFLDQNNPKSKHQPKNENENFKALKISQSFIITCENSRLCFEFLNLIIQSCPLFKQ